MLESELDEQLGYDRYDIQNKRNRQRNKKVRSDFGEVDISIPKDISTRYISAHINSVYGIEVSPSLISKITNMKFIGDIYAESSSTRWL